MRLNASGSSPMSTPFNTMQVRRRKSPYWLARQEQEQRHQARVDAAAAALEPAATPLTSILIRKKGKP
jgi:hypothetical protein